MNKFTPAFRKAPTKAIEAVSNAVTSLHGMSLAQVVQACQWKITAGKGKDRAATGATFLNCLTPKLFAANLEGTELYPIPQVYANFDNLEGGLAIELSTALSTALLKEGEIPQLQYHYKLIDSATKQTISTDMPEYEPREESTEQLPAFLQPTSIAPTAPYVPDPKVCAFLHIYVVNNDERPVRIASSNIEARFKPQVQVVADLVSKGHHIQAGVVPQGKVQDWLETQAEADEVRDSMAGFVAAAEATNAAAE